MTTHHNDDVQRWSDHDGGRSYLRSLPVLTGHSPDLDFDAIPEDPVWLFVEWLQQAVEAG